MPVNQDSNATGRVVQKVRMNYSELNSQKGL